MFEWFFEPYSLLLQGAAWLLVIPGTCGAPVDLLRALTLLLIAGAGDLRVIRIQPEHHMSIGDGVGQERRVRMVAPSHGRCQDPRHTPTGGGEQKVDRTFLVDDAHGEVARGRDLLLVRQARGVGEVGVVHPQLLRHLQHLAVERDHQPSADAEAVEAAPIGARIAAEVVEVRRGAGQVVLMIARRRPGAGPPDHGGGRHLREPAPVWC